MFRRYYNLVLMGVWLVMAWFLLAPDWALPEKARGKFGGLEGTLLGLLAVTFAVYNAVRWWAYQSLRRTRPAVRANPLAVRRTDAERESESYETNPELDFLKVPDAEKPPPGPSANGDHK